MQVRSKEVNVSQQAIVPRNNRLVTLYLWACERLYDELAWLYDVVSWMVSVGQWRSWQALVWKSVRGQRVLELGSGTGAMLAQGMEMGLRMTGVDRSPAMIQLARRRLEATQLDSCLVLGDGHDLPLTDGSFDTVFATFPAGYILDADTLAEIRRVLGENGRLVILGLWVELRIGIIGEVLPVFYGSPSHEMLKYIAQRVVDAGFCPHWIEDRQEHFTVGVLVADKE